MIDVEEMRAKFGDSDDASRQGVIDAHGGDENLTEWAAEWAAHHNIFGDEIDIFVAYCTAVDLGFRMGRKSEKP